MTKNPHKTSFLPKPDSSSKPDGADILWESRIPGENTDTSVPKAKLPWKIFGTNAFSFLNSVQMPIPGGTTKNRVRRENFQNSAKFQFSKKKKFLEDLPFNFCICSWVDFGQSHRLKKRSTMKILQFNCGLFHKNWTFFTMELQYFYIIRSINADCKQSTERLPCVRKIGNIKYNEKSRLISIICN